MMKMVADWWNRRSFIKYAVRSGFPEDIVRGDIHLVESNVDLCHSGQVRRLENNNYAIVFDRERGSIIVTMCGSRGLRSYNWSNYD